MARILVVEDEDLVRFTFREVLADAGHIVFLVNDGVEALKHLHSSPSPPDLLLCDLGMPKMGGVEFLRQLALEKYRGAIIIASGLDRLTVEVAEGLAKYRELNICGRLHKPCSPEELLVAVQQALNARSNGSGLPEPPSSESLTCPKEFDDRNPDWKQG